jgi:hypothetical protein
MEGVLNAEEEQSQIVEAFTHAAENGSLAVASYLDFISESGVPLVGESDFAVVLVSIPSKSLVAKPEVLTAVLR